MEPFVTITRLTKPHASCHTMFAEQKAPEAMASGAEFKTKRLFLYLSDCRGQAGFGDSGCSGAAFGGGMSFRWRRSARN